MRHRRAGGSTTRGGRCLPGPPLALAGAGPRGSKEPPQAATASPVSPARRLPQPARKPRRGQTLAGAERPERGLSVPGGDRGRGRGQGRKRAWRRHQPLVPIASHSSPPSSSSRPDSVPVPARTAGSWPRERWQGDSRGHCGEGREGGRSGRTEGQVRGRGHKSADGRTDRGTHGQTGYGRGEEGRDGQVDGGVLGGMDGQTDKEMDKWVGGQPGGGCGDRRTVG